MGENSDAAQSRDSYNTKPFSLANCLSVSQEIRCLLWNQKNHYYVQKNPLLGSKRSQINSIHTLPP
jgi:hypothetical protein